MQKIHQKIKKKLKGKRVKRIASGKKSKSLRNVLLAQVSVQLCLRSCALFAE